MSKILILYYTSSGNTKKMADAIAEGVNDVGYKFDLLTTEDIKEPAQLLNYDGYIVGSPVYYGLPAAEIKDVFDRSVSVHGRLSGRVGAAFASSANIGGGNESTCMAILQMMLVHGMVAAGSAQGDHYGPVAIGKPDERALSQCRLHGKRVAKLVTALKGADLKV